MKKVRKRSEKRGLPPGTLIGVGEPGHHAASARLITFGVTDIMEGEIPDMSRFEQPDPQHFVSWIDLDGTDNHELLAAIGQRFDLHPLLLEDVLNFDHRPKAEEFPNNLFVVVKMLRYDKIDQAVDAEQISFVLGPGYLISFQERPGDVLDPVRERLRAGLGRARRSKADYLLYALLDVIVDNYFSVLDELGDRISAMENKITRHPAEEDLFAIQELREQLILMGRYVTPTRELAGRLNTMEHPLILGSTKRFINDLQDHTVYIAETIGTMRDMLSSLENTYHAMLNLRMGQVMKLLAVISFIFIPLTFIAGLYGMNFEYMPELKAHNGYFIVLGTMALLVVGMVFWLKHRRWL
ncbi:MAG: magnesium/cobalt transporter CorA [Flavobacteriales bacterium]|nr:magnesium/cobalt transporter CorA [Flavobacteriales bacterium]